jgi:outer membrane protein assembly factor BamB
LIVNATNSIRGYDPLTGKELWRLGPNSQITTPTPVFGDGLIFVTNGYHPIQPIYAIRPGASGDISLKAGEEANTYVAWSKKRGGPYTPTPLIYDHHLYTCSNIGILTCYDDRTGLEIYRKRLGGSGGYSASPVAADGRIYLAGEDGEIRVVKAGSPFELLAINKMDDPCMATPAIADGMLLVRTQHYLYAIGWPKVVRTGKK